LPLADGSFDVVLSSLGLQFVPDKASALREMRRVLAPDGRLAIATVGPTPRLFAILEQALERYVKPEVAAFIRVVFSLHEPQPLEKLTGGAGFRDVEVRSKALTLTLPGPAEFLWQYVHSTPLAATFAQIDDVGRAALERDVVTGWRSFVKDGALADDVNVVLTTAEVISRSLGQGLARFWRTSVYVPGPPGGHGERRSEAERHNGGGGFVRGWQFWWSGVGGPTGRKCHPDWRLRPWLDRIMTGPTAGLGSAG